MKDYDELWEQYARGFVDKLDKSNGSDWSKLDETEQEMQMQDKPNQTAMMYTSCLKQPIQRFLHALRMTTD